MTFSSCLPSGSVKQQQPQEAVSLKTPVSSCAERLKGRRLLRRVPEDAGPVASLSPPALSGQKRRSLCRRAAGSIAVFLPVARSFRCYGNGLIAVTCGQKTLCNC